MLFVDHTNDSFYPLDILEKSYSVVKSPMTLCTRIGFPHGCPQHVAQKRPVKSDPGVDFAETFAFADSIVRNTPPLPAIVSRGIDNRRAWSRYESKFPIANASLNYTTSRGPWQERLWETIDGSIDREKSTAFAHIPAGASAYFFSLTDSRGLMVSSEHEVLG
jgi:hypothetical protein